MDNNSIKSTLLNKATHLVLFIFLNLALSVVFATTTTTSAGASDQINKALGCICGTMNTILPTIAFVLFVLSGVAYAAGNFFGAEMRARAVGYAMNMITGAIIALILSIIGPTIVSSLYGQAVSITCEISQCT